MVGIGGIYAWIFFDVLYWSKTELAYWGRSALIYSINLCIILSHFLCGFKIATKDKNQHSLSQYLVHVRNCSFCKKIVETTEIQEQIANKYTCNLERKKNLSKVTNGVMRSFLFSSTDFQTISFRRAFDSPGPGDFKPFSYISRIFWIKVWDPLK